jgi:hypothetical protein
MQCRKQDQCTGSAGVNLPGPTNKTSPVHESTAQECQSWGVFGHETDWTTAEWQEESSPFFIPFHDFFFLLIPSTTPSHRISYASITYYWIFVPSLQRPPFACVARPSHVLRNSYSMLDPNFPFRNTITTRVAVIAFVAVTCIALFPLPLPLVVGWATLDTHAYSNYKSVAPRETKLLSVQSQAGISMH